MAKIEVEIGHNIRAWTTFTITDPTPEEVEALEAADEDALALLAALYRIGRAVPDDDNRNTDDDPAYFDEAAEADIIDTREEN